MHGGRCKYRLRRQYSTEWIKSEKYLDRKKEGKEQRTASGYSHIVNEVPCMQGIVANSYSRDHCELKAEMKMIEVFAHMQLSSLGSGGNCPNNGIP